MAPFVSSLQHGCKNTLLHSFSDPRGRALGGGRQLQGPRGTESCSVRAASYDGGNSVQVSELRQESTKAAHSSDPSWHLYPVSLKGQQHDAGTRSSISITPWLCVIFGKFFDFSEP